MIKQKVSADKELISILFLSKIFSIITFSLKDDNYMDIYQSIIQLILNTAFIFLFSFLIYKLNKNKHLDIFEILKFNNKTFNILNLIVLLILSLSYFVLSTGKFINFTLDTIYEDSDFLVISILFFILIGYTLYNGLIALSKSSIIVLWLFFLLIIFLLFNLFKFDLDNIVNIKEFSYTFDLYSLFESVLNTFEFILILYFINLVKDKRKIYFNFIYMYIAIAILLIVIAQLVAGSLLKDFRYPFFFISRIIDISFFKKMDLFFILIWTFISFVKISAISFLILDILKRIFRLLKLDVKVYMASIFMFLVFISSYYFNVNVQIIKYIYYVLFVYLFINIFLLTFLRNRSKK